MTGLKISNYGYVLNIGNFIMSGTSDEPLKDEGVKKAYIGRD